MTEAEWLTGADPTPLLDFLLRLSKASDRKLRLVAVACGRCIQRLLPHRIALDVAEQFANGIVSLAPPGGSM